MNYNNAILTTMNWRNAHYDTLPEHKEEVLISVKGIYYLTKYDSRIKVFRLMDDPDTFFGTIEEEEPIYWISIDGPLRYSIEQ
jgi:hypothetical protein